jgi:pyruvate/2-oxoglutarate dehydrogenase complex dihydrolipoamide dehydrogenase (E3) component
VSERGLLAQQEDHSQRQGSVIRVACRGFGVQVGAVAIDMPGVRKRKRKMVDELVKVHLTRYEASGVDLIMGEARFVARGAALRRV